MTNHPNRSWRSRMRHACAKWMARWRWPVDGAGVLTPDQLRDLMGQAYCAGYSDGRDSKTTKAPT